MNAPTDFRRFISEDRERKDREGAGVLPFSTRTGKILLCKRAKGQSHAGSWCGFGGMMLDGETPEQAALRELREECGISERKVSLLKSCVYTAEGFNFHNFIGLVDFAETFAPRPGKKHKWEVAGHAWVVPARASELGKLHPGLAYVLRKEVSRMEGLDRKPKED